MSNESVDGANVKTTKTLDINSVALLRLRKEVLSPHSHWNTSKREVSKMTQQSGCGENDNVKRGEQEQVVLTTRFKRNVEFSHETKHETDTKLYMFTPRNVPVEKTQCNTVKHSITQ